MADTPSPADEPRSLFDKLGAGLPIALTALSTVFAGMSTGELSRAMYWRSTSRGVAPCTSIEPRFRISGERMSPFSRSRA